MGAAFWLNWDVPDLSLSGLFPVGQQDLARSLTSKHSHEVRTAGGEHVPVTGELRLPHHEGNVAQQTHPALLVEALQDPH